MIFLNLTDREGKDILDMKTNERNHHQMEMKNKKNRKGAKKWTLKQKMVHVNCITPLYWSAH